MTATLIETEERPSRSEGLSLPRPRTCTRCIHWGVIPKEGANDRWQLCIQEPVGMAHADYWCPDYERRART